MRWLGGHTKDVRAVAYLPDGRLVSGGRDKTVRVWNPVAGECLHVIKAHNVVYAVAAAPDGDRIAYGGRYPQPDSTANAVVLHDLTGESDHVWAVGWPLHPTYRTPARSVWSVSFSADGRFLAAAGRYMGGGNFPNGGGCWWTANPPGPWAPLLADDGYAAQFAPTGSALAVTRRRAIAFHDAPDRPERVRYRIPSDWAAAVAFPAPDAAVVAANSLLLFVDPTTKRKPVKVKTRHRTITALSASADGRTLLVGGKPGAVEEYDATTRALRRVYDFGVGGVHAVAVAPDGGTFAVGGDTGVVVCDRDD